LGTVYYKLRERAPNINEVSSPENKKYWQHIDSHIISLYPESGEKKYDESRDKPNSHSHYFHSLFNAVYS